MSLKMIQDKPKTQSLNGSAIDVPIVNQTKSLSGNTRLISKWRGDPKEKEEIAKKTSTIKIKRKKAPIFLNQLSGNQWNTIHKQRRIS